MQITLLEWNNMVENAEDDACANWCCYTDEKQCLTRNLWRSFRPHTFTTPQPMRLPFFVFSLFLSLSLFLSGNLLLVRAYCSAKRFINLARVLGRGFNVISLLFSFQQKSCVTVNLELASNILISISNICT